MMKSMIKENGITFKELEKNIFRNICKIGQECTKELFEQYDKKLMEERDRSKYRHKGSRKTTIKTIYGEVEYKRNVYEMIDEDGFKRYVYLLDEALNLEHVGLISENMTDLMVKAVTEMSYRQSAEKVTEMTGQSISAMGVWNVIQELGEKICHEEKELVKEYKAGQVQGEMETQILFEEADGVYVSLQGKDRKEKGKKKAEIKVAIAYDGWEKKTKDRYALHNKIAVAGFSESKDFQEYREAAIAEKFNLDEVATRVLNGDGGSWIKQVEDKETIFQLDPFHKNKAVRELIHEPRAQKDILKILSGNDIDDVFEYLDIYRNSLENDKDIEDVEALIKYYANNRAGLLPYREQLKKIPTAPEGLEYLNLGTMENHIWSIIARRMKNNHTSWSKKGGNYLAKILAKKCSGKLYEVTEKRQRHVFKEEEVMPLCKNIMSAAKVTEKVGKGYEYPVKGKLPSMDMSTRGDRKKLLSMAGY